MVGLLLIQFGAGALAWTLTVSLGFPLVASFAAVGLYETSLRMEKGENLNWAAILWVRVRQKDRRLPWAGAVIVIHFLFRSIPAHMIFALFMGPSALIDATTSIEIYLTPTG